MLHPKQYYPRFYYSARRIIYQVSNGMRVIYWHANVEVDDKLLAGPGWITFALA